MPANTDEYLKLPDNRVKRRLSQSRSLRRSLLAELAARTSAKTCLVRVSGK